jgi:hypothetical protein
MMSEDEFGYLVSALLDHGIPQDMAESYAARLGDTIEEDPNGKWVIRDDAGWIVARIDPIR